METEVGTEIVESAPAPIEKMLSQSQVNALVGKEKSEAAQRARTEAQAEYEAKLSAMQQPAAQAEAPSGFSVDQMVEQKMQAIMKQREQDSEREEYERGMNEVANSYYSKLEQGKELFEDFESITGDYDPKDTPHLTYLLAQMEDMPAVMYDLNANPSKMAQLSVMASTSPKLAQKELARLSKSIAQNQKALDGNVAVQPPLSRPQKSTVGSDNGSATVRDLKQADWLRG